MAKMPEIKQPMWTITEHGLTKRELFAAMAMQGFCSAVGCERMDYEKVSELSARQADALLARLEGDDAGD